MVERIEDLQALARDGFEDWESLGYIKAKRRDDLALLAYTKQAQAGWHWGPVERLCRGLILRMGTGEVVARPFDKFFNWGKEGATEAPLVMALEKMDGSLGIHYRHEGEHCIATRGSFDSPQAQWATEKIRECLRNTSVPDSWTLLFEIIYPENRIVVDYEGREELSLLAIRDRHTGEYLPHVNVVEAQMLGGFGRPRVHEAKSHQELVDLLPTLDANQEGFVGIFADGSRWKFKGDEYKRMHRFATQLTTKAVGEAFASGSLSEAWGCVPSHRREQFANDLVGIVDAYISATRELDAAVANAPTETRKDFALWLKANAPHVMPAAFARLDRKPSHDALCKILEVA